LNGDLQFSKFLKNPICIGLCKLKCTEKRFIPFTPLHFLPEFVPHKEFKGRPEDAKWNVLNHTSFKNYAPFSLQVPSILSILLGRGVGRGSLGSGGGGEDWKVGWGKGVWERSGEMGVWEVMVGGGGFRWRGGGFDRVLGGGGGG
jgi:hypothetical protein